MNATIAPSPECADLTTPSQKEACRNKIVQQMSSKSVSQISDIMEGSLCYSAFSKLSAASTLGADNVAAKLVATEEAAKKTLAMDTCKKYVESDYFKLYLKKNAMDFNQETSTATTKMGVIRDSMNKESYGGSSTHSDLITLSKNVAEYAKAYGYDKSSHDQKHTELIQNYSQMEDLRKKLDMKLAELYDENSIFNDNVEINAQVVSGILWTAAVTSLLYYILVLRK